MPPYCKIQQADDAISDDDVRPLLTSPLQAFKETPAPSTPPLNDTFAYPAALNASAVHFDSCWVDCGSRRDDGGDDGGSSALDISIRPTVESTQTTLLDDVTLCRLSSFLEGEEHVGVRRLDDQSDIDRREAEVCTASHTPRWCRPSSTSAGDFDDRLSSGPALLSFLNDAALVLPALLPSDTGIGSSNSVANFLSGVGIDEVETLNRRPSGPTAGQCLFSCIATALSRGSAMDLEAPHFRPDLELRQLALHVISCNPTLYRDFLLEATGHARRRTRSKAQSEVGGRAVDLGSYLRTMSNPACDGDAVTLQALCDALKITIRVVKPVRAETYQHQRYVEKIRSALSKKRAVTRSPVEFCRSISTASTVVEDMDTSGSTSPLASWSKADSMDEEGEISSTCTTSTTSSDASSTPARVANVTTKLSSCVVEDCDVTGERRFYISHEFKPRRLSQIDSRLRDVQRQTRGRLIWLSHIGDEAHYRFLRPSLADEMKSREQRMAQSSCRHRVARLSGPCSLQDGYIRTSGLPPSSLAGVKTRDAGRKPCCGLCLQDFRDVQVLSPSCCRHEFCRDCLIPWTRVCLSCPTCGSSFSQVVEADSGATVAQQVFHSQAVKFPDTSGLGPDNPSGDDEDRTDVDGPDDDSSISSKDTETTFTGENEKSAVVIDMEDDCCGRDQVRPVRLVLEHETPRKSNCSMQSIAENADPGCSTGSIKTELSRDDHLAATCRCPSPASTVKETPFQKPSLRTCELSTETRTCCLESLSKLQTNSTLTWTLSEGTIRRSRELVGQMDLLDSKDSKDSSLLRRMRSVFENVTRDYPSSPSSDRSIVDSVLFMTQLRQALEEADDLPSTLRRLLDCELLLALRLVLTPPRPVADKRRAVQCSSNKTLAEECARVCLLAEKCLVSSVEAEDTKASTAPMQEGISYDQIRRSDGLPKLLLWNLSASSAGKSCSSPISFNSTRMSSKKERSKKERGGNVHRLLCQWASKFGVSRVECSSAVAQDANQRSERNKSVKPALTRTTSPKLTKAVSAKHSSTRKSGRTTKAASTGCDVSGKRRRTTVPKRIGSKRRRQEAAATVVSKIAAPKDVTILTTTHPPTKDAPVPWARGPGKRKVRPVTMTNLSREHMNLRTYSRL